MNKENQNKGKLIVIDGTDGSGKATQVKLLYDRLAKEKIKVKHLDFPRYEDNFFGKLIGECLSGKYGDFISVPPKIASVIYAADRWESSNQIKKWLDTGHIVILDRYVSSNQIHQGAKILNNKDRKDFLGWLNKMEFEVFGIPKPDAIIFLEVPIKITQQLLKDKSLSNKKKYLEGKGDLAENNPKHLNDARKSALKLIKELNNFIKISCANGTKMRERESIHEDIYKEVITITGNK